ncbi:MAG: chitobiase/beta-hexosaminidase C-terminal domain-containing protein [Clostridia bacterium]|nr:chitobiase/beta-hexosaminidase C-terminal domain-containing protein [Clostridia bacterium]
MNIVASKSGTVYKVFTGCNNWSHENGKTCQQLKKCSPNTQNYYSGMCNYGYGRGVIIKHSDGTFSEYAHMSTVSVKNGQKVTQGEIIGKSGAYGNAYGAHLHFSLAKESSIWDKFNNNPKDRYSSGVNYIYSLNYVKDVGLSTEAVYGGTIVTLTCATGGAVIYYTTNGADPVKSGTKYTGPFTLTSTKTIKAYAAKSGMSASKTLERKLTVDKVIAPVFSSSLTATGYNVKISTATAGATVYYTTDGSAPTTSSTKYIGNIMLADVSNVKAIAVKPGMANSDVASQSFQPVPPAAPVIRLRSAVDIGIGDALEVEWDEVGNTLNYDVFVKDSAGMEQVVTSTGTLAALTLSAAESYTVTAKANNAFGTGPASNALTVVVHDNVLVTFENDDGSILSEQSVKYGENATAPVAPTKYGYTFTGWNGNYYNVREDTVVVAEYIPEQYRIAFVDNDGTELISRNVNFGEAFPEDLIPAVGADTGYRFSAWVKKSGQGSSFECANGDAVFEPSFVWVNPDVPLAVSIVKAERKTDSTGYVISAQVTNGTAANVDAKMISVIKTSYGKLLATEITDVSIPANALNVALNVNIVCKEVGKLAQVYLVANDKDNENRTGGAYSEVVSAVVTKEESAEYTYWSDWTDWQTAAVNESDTKEVETKVQYSYRDKQTTSSTDASLSGWTQDGSSVSYGSWGSWSGWSLTSQTKTDTKDVETRTVYYYYHYCDGNGNFAPSTGYTYGKYGPHTLYSTTKLKIDRTSTTGLSIADGEKKCEKNCGSYYYGGTKTQYRYRTRTKTTTYTYWKWGEWSDYSDAVAIASDNKQVQTRTVYRYRDLLVGTNATSTTDIGTEPAQTGEAFTVSGAFTNTEENYAGKLATVMVYKERNVDPTEEQMEYVSQIVIGENNTYSFSFIPKEEISVATGDYIVAFGLSTANRLLNNVERIEAPRPVYDVTFKSYDGTILSTQQVYEGDAAEEPYLEAPEGHEIRWNRTFTNITRSVEITALTQPITYTLVFVDWANSEIVRIDTNAVYGSEINFPPARAAVGKTFIGWSLSPDARVYRTEVIEALYEDEMETVTFLKPDGSVFIETEVPFGSNAELPECKPEEMDPGEWQWEELEFLMWDEGADWQDVQTDVAISPVLVYAETAETPVVVCDEDVNIGQAGFALETATADAVIHYTLDGSEPNETDPVFSDEPVVLTKSTMLKAKAFKRNANPSATAEMEIDVIPESDVPVVEAVTNVSQYEIGEDYSKLCMRLRNPKAFPVNSFGCVLRNLDTEEMFENNSTSIAGSTDSLISRVITVRNLEPGQYVYSFYAEIEGVGTIVSESETFVIDGQLSITSHPISVTAAPGAAATFTVKAAGVGVTYAWRTRPNSSASWTYLTEATEGYNAPTLKVPATAAIDGYKYQCVVTDAGGNKAYSRDVTLTVKAVSITQHPAAVTAAPGTTATFSVKAAGAGLTYQWRFRNNKDSAWINCNWTGYNTDTIKASATAATNGRQYQCVVTDAGGNKAYSRDVTLTVKAVSITQHPAAVTAAPGTTATFTVKATGVGLTYQWRFRNNKDSAWINCTWTGYNTDTIKASATAATNGRQYQCVVTDAGGNKAYSRDVTLTVK